MKYIKIQIEAKICEGQVNDVSHLRCCWTLPKHVTKELHAFAQQIAWN